MQKRTTDKMQKQLDELRFWTGKVTNNFEMILEDKDNESFYHSDCRRRMQDDIDHIKELQNEIEKLQNKQKEIKIKFYTSFDLHSKMSKPI